MTLVWGRCGPCSFHAAVVMRPGFQVDLVNVSTAKPFEDTKSRSAVSRSQIGTLYATRAWGGLVPSPCPEADDLVEQTELASDSESGLNQSRCFSSLKSSPLACSWTYGPCTKE